MFYWFAFYFVKMLAAVFSPRTVLGKEYIPLHGSFILASNHLSNIDPFLIGLCFNRRVSYMAKDTLFGNPILRFMLDRVDAFPVRREASDIRAIRETLRRLKKGLPVLMFPEGTRKGSSLKMETQSGLGFLAVKGNVPVVPVHISGTDKVLPPGAKVPRRNRVTISFGRPILFSVKQPYAEIVSHIMGKIENLSK